MLNCGVYGVNNTKRINLRNFAMSDQQEKEDKVSKSATNDLLCCDYYQNGMDKINSFIVTASIRAGENMYDGKPFVYCPWCGANTRK